MTNPSDKTTVIIADDHPIFRSGLVQTLRRDSAFHIAGEAGDGHEALQSIRETRPDIAILDISMPGLSGLDVVRELTQGDLDVDFVILTMYDDEAYFNEAIDLGVKGYVLKDDAAAYLLDCLRRVAQGRRYVTPHLSDHFVNRVSSMNALLDEKPVLRELTTAERRILGLIAQNKTSREIAAELFVSRRTVQNHRANICRKLGLQGHNKLLQFALENKPLSSTH